MSGSGGYGGYEPPLKTIFDCEFPKVKTNISSIDLDVLKLHKVGDELDLEISKSGSLVLCDGDGQTLGSIVHINTVDIINCIKNGNNYKGKILIIQIPVCNVQILKK